jgi:hypothetical protein
VSDYSSSSASYSAITGASGTIITSRPNSQVLAIITSGWSFPENDGHVRLRINRDSGAEYKYYGYQSNGEHASILTGGAYTLVGGFRLFTGLTEASHTFAIEAAANGSTLISNGCATQAPQEFMELILIEV